MTQLANLAKGLISLEKQLSDALTNDLGKDAFVNWLFEIKLVLREIDHAQAHLKAWMKDESVDTPLAFGPGKSYI